MVVERRAGDGAPVDRITDGERVLEGRAEVAGARDAGQQQLPCRGGHDHRPEKRRIERVPVGIVGVPVDHQVDVHVPQAGQHTHAFGRDHLGVVGNSQRSHLADGPDAFAVDEDHAVAQRRTAEAVDEGPADEGFYGVRLGKARQGEADKEQAGQRFSESSGHRSAGAG